MILGRARFKPWVRESLLFQALGWVSPMGEFREIRRG